MLRGMYVKRAEWAICGGVPRPCTPRIVWREPRNPTSADLRFLCCGASGFFSPYACWVCCQHQESWQGPQHRSKGHRVWKQGGPIFGRSRDLGPSNSEISGSGVCGAPGCEHQCFLAMACRCWTGFA